MKNGLEIYKDKSGHFWIEGMCDTIRDLCGEQCEEGCSVFDAMQKIGRESEIGGLADGVNPPILV